MRSCTPEENNWENLALLCMSQAEEHFPGDSCAFALDVRITFPALFFQQFYICYVVDQCKQEQRSCRFPSWDGTEHGNRLPN